MEKSTLKKWTFFGFYVFLRVKMKTPFEILKFPDPRLRQKAPSVEEVTPELRQFAKDLLETMYKESGVGLAAIQVNQPIRLFTADTKSPSRRYEDEDLENDLEKTIEQPLFFFNPEIIYREGQVVFPEGCLSFPSYYADVQRSKIIEVKALDINGKPFTLKTDGLLAICVQHEIDHLDGKLFIDHLSPVKAESLRNKIKKHGYPSPESSSSSSQTNSKNDKLHSL